MLDTPGLIRPARSADIDVVVQLYQELDATHEVLDRSLMRRGTKERRGHLVRALHDRGSRFVVAVVERAIVGFLMASFARSGTDVQVEAISVARQVRRRGLGSSLMKDVERWARQRGARDVVLQVYEFNPEARAFYEKLGYLTTMRTMRKDTSFKMPRFR